MSQSLPFQLGDLYLYHIETCVFISHGYPLARELSSIFCLLWLKRHFLDMSVCVSGIRGLKSLVLGFPACDVKEKLFTSQAISRAITQSPSNYPTGFWLLPIALSTQGANKPYQAGQIASALQSLDFPAESPLGLKQGARHT